MKCTHIRMSEQRTLSNSHAQNCKYRVTVSANMRHWNLQRATSTNHTNIILTPTKHICKLPKLVYNSIAIFFVDRNEFHSPPFFHSSIIQFFFFVSLSSVALFFLSSHSHTICFVFRLSSSISMKVLNSIPRETRIYPFSVCEAINFFSFSKK